MPLESTAENPLPVRTVAKAIGDWVARLGRIWIEGQLTEISKRAGTNTAFLTLRDPIADVSLQVACPRAVVESVQPPLERRRTGGRSGPSRSSTCAAASSR